ncbi:hypothetical protein N24_2583 [Corynebacterium suranareeae]|uniref:Uncharacterized protein n=2 Tax=Corynebacterium suranareeae TaxID=2506452 RepID=A0A160PT03_9CORY|nr:hypothetical protein [Corynebacterium suranareeae]BAU96845.1 hypothetical protein N24_2583 [Corynebacterium suranareeae]
MADSPDQETRRFAAVRASSETVGSPTQVPAKHPRNSSIIGLILILIAIIVLAGILLINSLSSSSDDSSDAAESSVASDTPSVTPSDTSEAEDSAGSAESAEQPTETTAPSATQAAGNRPAQPSLPADASPANAAAQANTDAGDLNNVYTGSASTSTEFAQAVRDAFVNHYLETDELSGQVTATSPVTGGNYTMNCTDNGEYVTCTGGNNAVVYIS